ncbi:hypothetical protein DY000_02032222 [Brassica cretica]|uniref:Uncharacterized protein n=1 Tax=Brassica cretica TaxID=69181 RepID=A0ABQ7DKQ3_BRACR|nr:hypothetical protein DY000_02032222 [Brassica cretica]
MSHTSANATNDRLRPHTPSLNLQGFRSGFRFWVSTKVSIWVSIWVSILGFD